MKLATLKDGTRDGQLVVVSRDLHTAAIADAIAPTMQRVIEDWSFYAPQLRALYDALNAGRARRAFGFDPKHCMAPLPRAYRLLGHVVNAADASGTPAASLASAVALRADQLLGAHDDIVVAAPEATLDFRSGWAAILSDIPLRATPERAAEHVRLLMLGGAFATAVGEGAASASRAFGLQAHCAFSPVAVTPDELGEHWQRGKVMTPVDVQINGRRSSRTAASADAKASTSGEGADVLDLPVVTAGLVRGQSIAAGTVLLSGPASSMPSAASTEKRVPKAVEGASEATAAWLGFGDRVRIDWLDAGGESVCGAIELSISPADDA